MIKINLLPIEKRKPERTPLPRFFLIVVGAALATVMIIYLLAVYFQINAANRDITGLSQTYNGLRADEMQYNRLEGEKQTLATRMKDIQDVKGDQRPVYWTQIMDALWETVVQNKRIWLEDFKTMDAKAAESELKKYNPQSRVPVKYGMVFRCGSAGDDVTHITAFRKTLQTHPFLTTVFDQITVYPEWTTRQEQDAAEKVSLSFSVAMFKLGQAAPPPTPPKPAVKK